MEYVSSASAQTTRDDLTLTQSPQALVYDQIRQHEGGWLLDILERPILVWGAQGSYKSYFAAYLALLRMHLRGHTVEINDPHLELNKNKAWRPLIDAEVKCYGSKFDYCAIAQRIEAFINRLKNADENKQWYSPIFDEITQYGLEPEIKEMASRLLLKCLSDCRKGNEAPILISHGDTLSLLGGSSGTHKARQQGLVQLNLLTISIEGKPAPLFKGELSGLPNSRGEFVSRSISIDPDWMNPDAIAQLFQVTEPVQTTAKEVTDLLPSDCLREPLKTIWVFAKQQNDWITVRQIMRKNYSVLKDANSDEIREHFNSLSNVGAGSLQFTSNGVMFKAN